MPADQDIDAAVAEDSAAEAEAGREAIAMTVPEATEPLEPENLNILRDVLANGLGKLTGGQFTPDETPDAAEPAMQVPPGIAGPVLALSELTKNQPALKDYAFDAMDLLTTNDGLMELVGIVDGLSSDPAVLKLMKQAPDTDADADTDTDVADDGDIPEE